MTDADIDALVKRLRLEADNASSVGRYTYSPSIGDLMHKAADAIERLVKERDELRADNFHFVAHTITDLREEAGKLTAQVEQAEARERRLCRYLKRIMQATGSPSVRRLVEDALSDAVEPAAEPAPREVGIEAAYRAEDTRNMKEDARRNKQNAPAFIENTIHAMEPASRTMPSRGDDAAGSTAAEAAGPARDRPIGESPFGLRLTKRFEKRIAAEKAVIAAARVAADFSSSMNTKSLRHAIQNLDDEEAPHG